jgi:hypothetical protein
VANDSATELPLLPHLKRKHMTYYKSIKKQKKHKQKVETLISSKEKAYNIQQLLTKASPVAFEVIWDKYKEYEQAAFARRTRADYYSFGYIMLTIKTIRTVYNGLPENIQQLWDAVPNLKSWKEKYK